MCHMAWIECEDIALDIKEPEHSSQNDQAELSQKIKEYEIFQYATDNFFP